MNREHYWLLANALKAVDNTKVKVELVLKLCDILKDDNPKFDKEKFLDASGV